MSPSPNANLLAGPNGSGKTTLLEAIFLLSRGRSFRASLLSELIGAQDKQFAVVGTLTSGDNVLSRIALKGTSRSVDLSRDSESIAKREAATLFPVFLIGNTGFCELPPMERRKVLDWGVFLSSRFFFPALSNYQKCLKQRAIALSKGLGRELSSWEALAAKQGELLDKLRRDYVAELQASMREAPLLSARDSLELKYRRGWPPELELAACLHRNREKDRVLGYATAGPHRADLALYVDGLLARARLSRGESKLATFALVGSQAQLAARKSDNVCLLVDDVEADLDVGNRQIAFNFIKRLQFQSFIATQMSEWATGSRDKMFHVEHGCIT